MEPPRGMPEGAAAWRALGLSRSGLGRFLRVAQAAVGLTGEVSVLLADDRTLRRLNRDWRGKDKATDVLSFPSPTEMAGVHAGDLAVSLQTAARQAAAYGLTLRDELRVLLLHGLLHLKGMDHETDDGEMAAQEAELRQRLRLPSGLIARASASGSQSQTQTPCGKDKRQAQHKDQEGGGAMSGSSVAVGLLLCLLAIAAYVDRIYFEMGKFLSREYTENIDAWERLVEPKLHLSRESAAMSASVLRQVALVALTFLLAIRLQGRVGHSLTEIVRTAFELLLVLLVFDRLVPQVFFTRTRGQWIAHIRLVVQALFYVVLPVTLTITLLLSIAGLAQAEPHEPERPSEAMDALLEAGEEEGVLDEQDRELVRSVVEFGDKVVREVMTPRPEMFAVAGRTTLEAFTAEVNAHGFSRVPVYGEGLDDVTGIAFARDLLAVQDRDAAQRTVAELEKPALFVPETKKVNELLREMQRQKQHMGIVIDEYGGVAGLVTIEDLLEAIVGEIDDEHDSESEEESAVAEGDGVWVLPGGFEVNRLRDLFGERPGEACLEGDEPETSEDEVPVLSHLLETYEATTVGGLVSEIAGHIPLPGEVVEDGPLRLEVLSSTDRRVVRVRLSVSGAAAS